MIEFFTKYLLELIFCWPGALVRWLFLHKKKNFEEIFNDLYINAIVGITIISSVVGIILGLQQLLK